MKTKDQEAKDMSMIELVNALRIKLKQATAEWKQQKKRL